jgi:hypothetical protein
MCLVCVGVERKKEEEKDLKVHGRLHSTFFLNTITFDDSVLLFLQVKNSFHEDSLLWVWRKRVWSGGRESSQSV